MNTGDILTDLDVIAEDHEAATAFGSSPIKAKRDLATRWVITQLEAHGFIPRLHSIRDEPRAQAWSEVSSAYSDVSDSLKSETQDDFVFGTYINSTSDYLLVGSTRPFRGLYVSMLGRTNVNSLSPMGVAYWDGGAWTTPNSLVDGTLNNSISLNGGGRIMWQLPDDWERRPHEANADPRKWLYWVKLSWQSNIPNSSTSIGQLLPIRGSRLTRPMAQYCLGLFYREAIAGQRGNWAEKAVTFLTSAQVELDLILGGKGILDEFDADESQAVGDEAASVPLPSHEWLRG